MTAVTKIDSNATELRYQEETSIGVANTSNDFIPLEPNSYADFGGQITTVARNPINSSRQRKKGVTTDKDASGGFNTDLTQTNLQDILQGLMFADLRPKGEEAVTAVSGADTYEVASTTGFFAGSLVFGSGFTNTGNNGLKHIASLVADTSITVNETLVNEASPPSAAKIVVVGFEFTTGDLDVDASGSLPLLTSSSKDMTELGLVGGEWIFIGGDASDEDFADTENNGWKRVRNVAAGQMTVDKSDLDMSTVADTANTVRMFFGRVLKNESTTSLITRRTYQLERALGAPDDASLSQIQYEYIEGALFNEFVLNKAAADKITCDLSFIGTASSTIDGPTAAKTAGSRPSVVEADAFNSSSDIARMRLAVYSTTDEAPADLFAYFTEATFTFSNNATPNKACGVLGSFEITSGQFTVSSAMTAYFAATSAIDSVQNNDDVTLDLIFARSNAGIAIDFPLMALGDGRPNVAQDEAITIPITAEMASGAKIDSDLDHTAMFVWYDYLPTAAMPSS